MKTEPADAYSLSEEKVTEILAALNDKVPNSGKCPVCPKGIFSLKRHFVTPMAMTPGEGVFLGGATYPSVILLCNICGFTRMHNAILLGVYPKAASSE